MPDKSILLSNGSWQLTNRYKGIDAVRDGQIEARERLLTEMEEKARHAIFTNSSIIFITEDNYRERADLAEQEGYKLKGILSHMETVVQSLRSQGRFIRRFSEIFSCKNIFLL